MGNQEGGSNVVRQDADYLMTCVGGIDRQWCGRRQTAVRQFNRNSSAILGVALVKVLNISS